MEETKEKSAITQFFEKNKTIFYVALIGIVSVALLAFFYLGDSGSKYETLYEGLGSSDSIEIQNYLSEKNIAFKTDEGGSSIQIKSDVSLVKAELARRGLPSSSELTGLAKFDQMSIGSTKFDKEVQYQARLQEDLESGIKKAFEGIDSVSVKLPRIKEKSIFDEDDEDLTVSVALKLSSGVEMSEDNVSAIQLFVASSIQGLTKENVEIVDSQMNVLSHKVNEKEQVSDNGTKIKDETERKITEDLTRVLTEVYGQVNVITRVDINFDEIVQNIEQYDPEGTLLSTEEMSEREESTNEGPEGEPGANANGDIPGYEITNLNERDSSYTREKEHLINNFQVGKTVEKIIRHPELRNTNIAVWVDKDLTNEEIRNLEEMIAISGGLTGEPVITETDRLIYDNGSVKVVQTEFVSGMETENEDEQGESTTDDARVLPTYIWAIIAIAALPWLYVFYRILRRILKRRREMEFPEEEKEQEIKELADEDDLEKQKIIKGLEKEKEETLVEEDNSEDQFASEESFEFEWTNERRQLKTLTNEAVKKNPDVTASVIKEMLNEDKDN